MSSRTETVLGGGDVVGQALTVALRRVLFDR